jgi:hypothetical protein
LIQIKPIQPAEILTLRNFEKRPQFARRRLAMCDKCQEILARIKLYRRMMRRLDGDPQAIVGISVLIKEAEAEKLALHRPVQKP